MRLALKMCHRKAAQVELRTVSHNGYGSHLPYGTARCPDCGKRSRCKSRQGGRWELDCRCGMRTFINFQEVA
jgi:hypothetical protein